MNKLTANGVIYQIMVITPEIAKQYLQRNTHNRKIQKAKVEHFVKLLLDGLWTVSNDNIAFDVNGVLVNGQHRLQAVIDSGISITQLVMFGVPESAQQYMDVGTPRTLNQALSLAGISGGAQKAAAYVTIKAVLDPKSHKVGMETYTKYKELDPIIDKVLNHSEAKREFARGGIPGIIALLIKLHGESQVMEFFDTVVKGINVIDASNAAYQFREWYLDGRSSKRKEAVLYHLLFFYDKFCQQKLGVAADVNLKFHFAVARKYVVKYQEELMKLYA